MLLRSILAGFDVITVVYHYRVKTDVPTGCAAF
jgi:hypothetical protein